ncbi:MAG: hypothetical protein K2X47_08975 [Bdellovibrionales bacterium]|nr:hypothetical protein [Bdellovibrionales bacterium]
MAGQKQENLWLNISMNALIPMVILSKFSEAQYLGPVKGLLVSLAFPLGYGIYDLWSRRKVNFLSVLGIVSTLLTGGFGLMELDGFWFAVKEAAVPAAIGLAVILSMKTKYPLMRAIFYNDQIIQVDKVREALELKGTHTKFDQFLDKMTYGFASSFFVSSALNYGLARYLLKSPAGTEEFNAELARMTALSWPVIVLPSFAITSFLLWQLIRGIQGMTGLELHEILKDQAPKETTPSNSPTGTTTP